jgi:alanyl-tRNA synthetase
MLPFKPIFLGQRPAEVPRATTSQKCIRTNDIENVGRTARHHTFFEMLGNFSFGDYFKEQAIAWAWELSTEVFKLPPERLVVSVFREDDDAFAIWRDQVGIPAHRILRMDEADNFWTSGPTGPCGPCSEIYYDFHPELGDDQLDLEDDSRFIEFYNLVFMQYNRDAAGTLTPLQNQNIDTGLGLERMAQILQQVPNNYETDLILPIIEAAAKLADRPYAQSEASTQVSLKVIGDHVRAVVHMIADGITASNVGRGYILRRLIRRVVRHGRLIGITGPFTSQVAETAIALSEQAFPNVREREAPIKAELDREEARFLETLERGEKLLDELLAKEQQSPTKKISGTDAFVLYDTYGFPLELTQEIAEEKGLTVDVAGFEVAMAQQRQRSKDAHETIDLTVQGSLEQLAERIHGTTFLGYADVASTSQVEVVLVEGQAVDTATAGDQVQVILDQTPFYGESGGQVGDRGYLRTTHSYFEHLVVQSIAHKIWLSKGMPLQPAEGQLKDWKEAEKSFHTTVAENFDLSSHELFASQAIEYLAYKNWISKGRPQQGETEQKTDWNLAEYEYQNLASKNTEIGRAAVIRIQDVQKEGDLFVHFGRVEQGSLQVGDQVTAQIDRAQRRRAMANHTATHLLQAALKALVDDGISQAGSLVDFDRLRFDFNYARPLTPEAVQQVEAQVNTWIAESHVAEVEVMPLDAAKAKGAVAMFGEKYGAEVRVIDFPGVSMELCGGTHVSNTAEIGLFKIISETGVAAGVRRIEAVAGPAVLEYLNVRDAVVRDLADRFKAKPEELPDRITTLQADLKTAQKALQGLKSELAVAKADQLLSQAETVGEVKVLVAQLDDVGVEALKTAAERLLQQLGEGAVVLGSVPEADKVSLVAAFSPKVIAQKLQAGKFIGSIAKLCGGGGGGRPQLAQAGGRQPEQLPEALVIAKQTLIERLS